MLTTEEIRGFMLEDGIVDGVHVKKESSAPTNNGAQALRRDAQETTDSAGGHPRANNGSSTSGGEGV